jgi:uncharacterized surface protein with fasciclin (FAS1) repeats
LDPTVRLFILGHKASLLLSSLHKPNFREVIIFLDSSSFVVIAQVVDIVQTAIDNGNFQTLVDALTAADLVNTLQGSGPFTVFAPNDAAFDKLPVGVVDELLKPENNETLSRILQYHVTSGNLTAADIETLNLPANVTMLAGGSVTVSGNETSLKVNNAAVITPNVFATNGIIHVLDSVLLPPLDIVETAIVNGNFKTLVAALRAADLVATLKGPGPFTVFAPTEAAFSKLPNGTVEDLLQPGNIEKLADILKYHVLGQSLTSGDIDMLTLPAQVLTLEGSTVTVTNDGNNTKINNATVTTADVSNINGIIHIIDTVLMPSAPTSNSTTPTPVSTTTAPSSTTPVPGSSTPAPSSTTPSPGSTTSASSSTTPTPGSTTPSPGSTTPTSVSTTSASSSTTPTPGSTTPAASSSTPSPSSSTPTLSSPTPTPTSTTSAPNSTTPFYVNQGFFTVFLSTILFACLFSI